jgi:hypothetical protein
LTLFTSCPTVHAANDDDSFNVTGMSNLMLAEFILCIVSVGSTVLFFRDAPPTPPSQSTHRKIEVRCVWLRNCGDGAILPSAADSISLT